MQMRNRQSGFAVIELIVVLAVIGMAFFAWWVFGPSPKAQSAQPAAPAASWFNWDIAVRAGSQPVTISTVPAPVASPSVREGELEIMLEQERKARLVAERQLKNNELLLKALARLDAGEVTQARSELHRWASRQVPNFGDEVVLSAPIPARAAELLAPYRVAKVHDREGKPSWIVKYVRDDEAMARLK